MTLNQLPINQIINGDCLEVMKTFPDNSIDLVVTSPPYNCGIDYDCYNDNVDWNYYFDWCKTWLKEVRRVLKPDGRIALNILIDIGKINSRERLSPYADFYKLFQDVGINYYGSSIWIDNHRTKYTAWGSWLNTSSPYIYNPYEAILFGYKDVWKKQGKGTTNISKEDFMMGCSGIWKIKPETRGQTKACFPIELSNLCINLLSYENDVVLDPFIGSGTTALACEKLKRKWIGIEISKEYCEIAKKRVEPWMNQNRINDYINQLPTLK